MKIGLGLATTILVTSAVSVNVLLRLQAAEKASQQTVTASSHPASDKDLSSLQAPSTVPAEQTATKDDTKTEAPKTQAAATPVAAPVSTPTLESKTPNYLDTYPADLKNIASLSILDQWGLNNRGSASYTAWKVQESYGHMPKFWGDPHSWPVMADLTHIHRGTTPRVHSVAIVNNFSAWVEAVNGDRVDVSFYNFADSGSFGTWLNVPASQFSTYIYFN